MIVNGFPLQRAFTPFLFTSRASANQACRQADISSNASTRHMSCALDVYHPDESANLPNMFCNCVVHLVCWWFVHILFNTFRSKQPRRTSLQLSTECESTRHSGLQTGLRCLQKQNISDMTNGSGHYTEKASSRSPIFLWTSNWDGRMGDVLETSLHSYFHKEAFRCLSHKRRRQLRTTLRIRSDSLLAMRHCTWCKSLWANWLARQQATLLHKNCSHLIVIPKPWQIGSLRYFFGNLVDSELIWFSIFIDIPYMIHSDPIIRILAEPWLPGEEPRARAWACNTHEFLAPSPWRMKRLADAVGVRDPFWIL